jgi:hypothetical protein
MSLDPHWFSTIHGLVYVMGQGISALALSIICIVRFGHLDGLKDVFNESYLRDLGTLLFAFVMLWAYMCFSQYLIIWSGNLPEEIPWYLQRTAGGWQWVALALVLLHFALPFSLLLSRHLKRLSRYQAIIIDDIGYVQQNREEMEVLFTLLAERYERGTVMLTSNLPFSQWERIFKDPMTTAAAIGRLVHHSIILELNLPSYRLEKSKGTKKSTVQSES